MKTTIEISDDSEGSGVEEMTEDEFNKFSKNQK